MERKVYYILKEGEELDKLTLSKNKELKRRLLGFCGRVSVKTLEELSNEFSRIYDLGSDDARELIKSRPVHVIRYSIKLAHRNPDPYMDKKFENVKDLMIEKIEESDNYEIIVCD